jgi:hypothetical protein
MPGLPIVSRLVAGAGPGPRCATLGLHSMPDGIHITALCPLHDHGAASEKVGDWDALMQGVFATAPITTEAQVLVNLGLVHRDSEWHPLWEGCALLVGGGLAVTFGEHLLQPSALVFQCLGLRERRRINPALRRPPPEKRRPAHTMFTAKSRDQHAAQGSCGRADPAGDTDPEWRSVAGVECTRGVGEGEGSVNTANARIEALTRATALAEWRGLLAAQPKFGAWRTETASRSY